METVKIKFINQNHNQHLNNQNHNQHLNNQNQNQNIIQAFLNQNEQDQEPNQDQDPTNFLNLNNKFLQIQKVIEQKRKFLLKKQKKIHKLSKQNKFLEEIKEDYSKYNNYIIKQKNEQITALNMLNTYIHDLSRSNELSKDNIIDSEHEQQKIMREIKSIKQNLDSIIKPLQN